MDDNAVQKEKTPSPRGERSVSFPFYSLRFAVDRVREVRQYGKEFSPAQLAGYLGHAGTNSGVYLQKAASLKAWGLLEGRGAILKLSALAERIALSHDDADYQAAVREAFGKCAVFAEALQSMAKGIPLKRDALGNLAVQRLHVSMGAREAFVESLLESGKLAGAVSSYDDMTFVLAAPSTEPQAQQQIAPGGRVENAGVPRTERNQSGPGKERADSAFSQTWECEGGIVTVRVSSTSPLGASIFPALGDVVKAAEALAVKLGWVAGLTVDGDHSE